MSNQMNQVLESIISDVIFLFGVDRDIAEKVTATFIKNPKMLIELEQRVKLKRGNLA